MSFTTLQTDVTSSTLAPLTFKEAAELRQKAIKNMVAAIAAHDFVNARNYSNEEARLKHLLQDLEEPLTTA